MGDGGGVVGRGESHPSFSSSVLALPSLSLSFTSLSRSHHKGLNFSFVDGDVGRPFPLPPSREEGR